MSAKSSTKSIAILADKSALNMYTLATIRHLCSIFGVAEAGADEADVLWVSISDPDDIKVLWDARKIANGRPVIMGGFEAWFGVPYLAWADAVVVGEGVEFIRTWGEQGMDAALDLPCVLTMDRYKRGIEVLPSYDVGYLDMPIVKVGGKVRYYFLAGRGCKGKCSFCATSWVQPHSKCPDRKIRRVVKEVEDRKGKLTLISNDSDSVIQSSVVNAQSVRVVDYLREPLRYKSSMLHFGIEFWDEGSRAKAGKPISNEDIYRLFQTTAEVRQQMELFFIVGYPGWSMNSVEKFAENALPLGTDNSPFVHVKCTYLDPCPHTPLAEQPVNPEWCNIPEVFAEMNSRNKRIRVFPTRSAGRSAWRTALHRCTPEEALELPPEPKDTNVEESFRNFRAELDGRGLGFLLDGSRKLNEAAIKTRIK